MRIIGRRRGELALIGAIRSDRVDVEIVLLVLPREGSKGKLMQNMAKTDLLILDDWGLAPSATANGAKSPMRCSSVGKW